MTPHVATLVPPDVHALFGKIYGAVSRLPDLDLGTDRRGTPVPISCHALARAAARVFALPYVDGLFLGRFSHSWLRTPDRKWIIDCYPVGILAGPLLVDAAGGLSPGALLYKPVHARRVSKDLPFAAPPFRRAVRRLERALAVLANGGILSPAQG